MGTVEARAYERRWLVLLVLCCSLIVITLDNTILNVALPTLSRDLHANNSQLQWMVDSYVLVFAGLLLTAGSLGDRFGRRGALQVGLAIFGLGSVASALAATSNQLIATRALMGVGGAFIMPSTLSILTNTFPANERGRAIGIWAGISGVGIAIGPLAGGFLLEHFYWGSIFLVNVPIVLLAIVAGRLIVPTSKDPSAPPLDPPGALLSITGLTALVYAIIEAPQEGWTDTKILAAFAIAAVLLVAFALWELHRDHPMLDVTFFRNPRFTAASSAITLVFFALFGSMFLFTQYFQFVLRYSTLQTGLALLPFALTIMITAPLSARFVERFGSKVVVATGLALVTTSLLLMTQVHVDSGYANIIWRLMLMSIGMGNVMAPATDSIMGSLPLGKAGVGSAVNDTTRQVGGALGVAIIGSVLSSGYGAKMGDFLAGTPIPSPQAAAIKHSLGAALAASQRVGGPVGDLLATTAKTAFVDGMHSSVLVGAAAALVGAVVVAVWLPARARREDVLAQEAQYRGEQVAQAEQVADAVPSAAAEV